MSLENSISRSTECHQDLFRFPEFFATLDMIVDGVHTGAGCCMEYLATGTSVASFGFTILGLLVALFFIRNKKTAGRFWHLTV